MRSRHRSIAMVSLAIAAAMGASTAKESGRLQMVQHADAQPSRKPPSPTDATLAYREAMTQLQVDISIRYSGNADRDFATLLLAQSKALETLVALELQHGTDPKMRDLAEQVRKQAHSDMADARAWQAGQKDP